jgi:1-phosphofructokinase family hexose kinase
VIVVGGFNTALDKLAETDVVEPGAVLRVRNVRTQPGGKGLHVALACAALHVPVTLVGLIDEQNRRLFETTLTRAGVSFVGVTVHEPIRTCLAIHDAQGRTTEFLEPGPDVSPAVAATLHDVFAREADRARVVVLSGSLPPGLPSDTYATLVGAAGGDRVLLDSSGDALREGLSAAPLLVKPSRQEAEQVVGFSIRTLPDAARAAASIGARGPRLVMLSLGAQGAMLWTAGRAVHVAAPEVPVRNAVGAGDCLLGGFAVGLLREWPVDECARYAVACGTAKVMHAETGVMRREDVEHLARSIAVTPLL